jgi:HSP20 family protein
MSEQRNKGREVATRPEHPMDLFRSPFDRLWNHWLAPWGGQGFEQMRVWDLDVSENDKEIVVRAEVPGFDEKELDVRLNNDVLTIRAEREEKAEGREQYRSFSRTVTLPPGVDADKAQATYRNGVLELHFPRPEGARARRIPIQGQPNQAGTPGTQTAGTNLEKARK